MAAWREIGGLLVSGFEKTQTTPDEGIAQTAGQYGKNVPVIWFV